MLWQDDDTGYDYFPLNGNVFSVDETGEIGIVNVRASSCIPKEGRSRINCGSLISSAQGNIVIDDFGDLFEGGCITNNGCRFEGGVGGTGYASIYGDKNHNSAYPYPIELTCNEDATYSFWIKVDELPASGFVDVFKRQMSSTPYNAYDLGTTWGFSLFPDRDYGEMPKNYMLGLCINDKGQLVVKQESGSVVYNQYDYCRIKNYYIKGNGERVDVFPTSFVEPGEWHHICFVGKAKRGITVYLDGIEAGNVESDLSFAWMPPIDMRFAEYSSSWWPKYYEVFRHNFKMTIGGWNGLIDEMVFYHKALTSKEVGALYEDGVVNDYVYHTVTQGVVEPTLSIDSAYMPKGGGSTNVSLTVAKGVNWTATTSASWLSIVGDKSGTGPADFTIKVAANPTVVHRVGTVTIAGKAVTITQEGLACEVIYSNPTFSVEGDVGSITVNPEGGGSWTATTDDDWIYIIFGESGTGSGEVMFITEQYLDTTSSRTGIITIGEEKVYITQRGYQLSIEPMVAEVGGNAGAGRIGVAADPDSIWTAIAQEDWITIVTGGEGIGDGTILYTVTDNTTGQTRTGHIYISGQMYTITQTCTLKLTATVVGNGSVNGAGDYSQGKQVTLRAVPDAGNVFSHWSGDVVGNDEVTTVKMDSVKNVTATFIPESAAQKLAEQKAAQGGFYTRDQIHALEMGNLVFDVDSSGTARIGVQLMETSDLSDPNGWKPATLNGNPDVGQDGTVGMKVKAEGNAKFFKVVMPEQK